MQLPQRPVIHLLPTASRIPRADVCNPSTAPLTAAPLAGLGLVSTTDAARLLARQPATLQRWASTGGPLSPVRINGRLGWRTADLELLLRGAA
jgi:hypothetical protein